MQFKLLNWINVIISLLTQTIFGVGAKATGVGVGQLFLI